MTSHTASEAADHADDRAHRLELEKLGFERVKLQADATKHISTLASGTIVLLATFMDKMHKPLIESGRLQEAICWLLACVFLAFLHLWATALLRFNREPDHTSAIHDPRTRLRVRKEVYHFIVTGMYMSFCLGLFNLGVFTWKNIPFLQ